MAEFTGFLASPKNFNNISLIILSSNSNAKNVCTKLSKIGVECLRLENISKESLESCIKYLYRFSEKIMILAFDDYSDFAASISNELDNIDCLVIFDPQREYPQDLNIRAFSKDGLKGTIKYDILEYAALFSEDNDLSLNHLWNELDNIIQFI